ncbi:methyl-accepting chemotaxis protein [Desulfopila sp. IMCC35008]|uniref:methyl-accepting chemotaxis protein n=1 Tax=Desulfopila sp. IMCC35008 TaxID=2653858 RepID=UPI0013D2BE74|nr:methyl-accepting chemotaxis protein [Desulfopila sp. IMCC35008]
MAKKKFRTFRFTTKLFVSVCLICVISILITSGNAIRMADNGLLTLGKDAMEHMHKAVMNSLLTYDETIRKKLDSDIGMFEKELKSRGSIILDNYNAIETTITHQITKQSEKVELPKMMAGGSYITGKNDIVDSVLKHTGSSATIFQLVDNKLLRISTTVMKQDGERAIGTYIPSDSPVYKTIMSGEVFKGKAYVVNDWYITEYAPLIGSGGKVVGAVYCGQLMISDEIANFLNETKLNNGYFFTYNNKGDILTHPTIQTGDNLFKMIPQLQGHQKGFIEYDFEGTTRTTYVTFIDKWGTYLGLSMSHEDIIKGLDITMMKNNLLVGLMVITGGIIVTILLVRTINRPLQELAEKSAKVGEGDYTIQFESKSDDAIGKLAESLELMVGKSKEMLQDIVRSSQSLSQASSELADISDQMVGNADSTAKIADEASGHASDVSDNMNSVSAAMEQSTTNLDMIAAASEEMGNTIKEIADNSSRARITTEEAVAMAKVSHEGVQGLGDAAKSIGTVTETITEISEQTNLLALNATIEAARAGEAGKGFAVVANEIKELARETANATGQIKQAIHEIQNQTSTTVVDIESITTVIQDVNDVVNSIVTAVEEQSITTNEIVKNVGQASQGITEINQNVAESNQMTTMVSDGVDQVKEKAVEVKAKSEYLQKSADDLSGLSDTLTGLVSRFKI